MNKLLKGAIALVLFAFAIGIFEMCSKENVIAQAASYVLPIATPTTLGGVKPDGTTISVDATGKISSSGSQQQSKIIFAEVAPLTSELSEIWIANYDGTNATKITLPTLPSGFEFKGLKMSPDGQTIFIAGYDPKGNISQVYSMTNTGTNFKKIISYDGWSASSSLLQDLQAF